MKLIECCFIFRFEDVKQLHYISMTGKPSQEQDFTQLTLTIGLILKQIIDSLYCNVFPCRNMHSHCYIAITTGPDLLKKLVLLAHLKFQVQTQRIRLA